MGMGYFIPPGVAGWKAYYQKPAYYKLWINAATMQIRNNFVSDIFDSLPAEYPSVMIDLPAFLNDYDVESPLALVDMICDHVLAHPIVGEQKSALLKVLIGNEDPAAWSRKLKAYRNGEMDEDGARTFQGRFILFLKELFNMTEFQLI
jgi:hypothetical protein